MEYQAYDKFEYKSQTISFRSLTRILNELGQEGWELIDMEKNNYDNGRFCLFKRKLICTNIIND